MIARTPHTRFHKRGRLRELLLAIKESFWFLPSLGLLGGVLLGIGMVEVDIAADTFAERWPRFFGASAEGTRGLLAAIAGSMITVAGVVFSVTVVALSLAASSYSPRVLRTFMHDRVTQASFAVFVGIYVYCLVVLRTVRSAGEGAEFVPSVAVLTALGLALAGVWALVFFIHHLSVSIQVSTIVERIAAETRAAIENLYPDELGPGEDEPVPAAPAGSEHRWRMLPALRSGYLVAADFDALLAFACARGARLRLELAVGEFAIATQPLAALEGSVDDAAADARVIDGAFAIAEERSIEQDVAFGIQQILDIAARALSPGINNPSTAALCTDHLSALYVALARRPMPLVLFADKGEGCLIAKGPTFDALVDLTFGPLVRDAARQAETLEHLERVVRRILAICAPRRRPVLRKHLDAIERARRAERERREAAPE